MDRYTTKYVLKRSPYVHNEMQPLSFNLVSSLTSNSVCYEYGGCVTGAAVLVDDRMPLACRCRISTTEQGVYLRTESRDIHSGDLVSYDEVDVCSVRDLLDGQDPTSSCALLKCTLLQLGLLSPCDIPKKDEALQPIINFFCRSTKNVRMEIVATSLLPQGIFL